MNLLVLTVGMLMVKIESYAIGSAFGRGQARGRCLFARIQSKCLPVMVLFQWTKIVRREVCCRYVCEKAVPLSVLNG